MKTIILIFLLLMAGAFILVTSNSDSQESPFKYVITETGGPTSLDPLDGDQTQNLSFQRMIYATPVEVNPDGVLESQILREFTYDPDKLQLKWKLKSNAIYSDGSKITSSDVALAVLRMAYARPKFPVIENIQGLDEWLKTEHPLNSFPEGVAISDDEIVITFSKQVEHPLFRFCLEIFSVIPKKCINLQTNKINCDQVPSSGMYTISEKSTEKIDFKLRSEYQDLQVPRHIIFEYKLPKDVFQSSFSVPEKTVIQGNEVKLSVNQLSFLDKNLKKQYLPSSRIALNLLNPNVGAFKNKNCRVLFAQAYRSAFQKLNLSGLDAESSVFTDIVPGYMTTNELSQFQISATENESCLDELRKNPPSWAKVVEDEGSIFSIILEKTFDELNIKPTVPLVFTNTKQEREAFFNGKVAVIGASTGFWAQDPGGDIQMLLTPNMHKLLSFVSSDEKLQSLIRNLKIDGQNNLLAYKAVNKYIHDEALFNVFAHVRRFYAADSLENINQLSMAITSPAPWQVFKVSK